MKPIMQSNTFTMFADKMDRKFPTYSMPSSSIQFFLASRFEKRIINRMFTTLNSVTCPYPIVFIAKKNPPIAINMNTPYLIVRPMTPFSFKVMRSTSDPTHVQRVKMNFQLKSH